MKKKKIAIGSIIGSLLIGFAAISSLAASTLFGEASVVAGGNPGMALQTVSDADPGFGGASFDDANGTLFSSLATLSTDYNVTDDDCGAGSPRFQVRIDVNDNGTYEPFPGGDGNIFVYLGPSPSFVDCLIGWQSSGNLIGNNDPGRWSSEQVGGVNSGTYAQALAAVGGKDILSISLVIDSGWNSGAANGVDGEQTVLFDNVTINSAVYGFEPPTPGPFDAPEECTDVYGAPIVGTASSDNINGTSGNDLIFALGGSDRVNGKGGNDCIVGGDGSDRLTGANGDDVILGGAGSDSIDGGNQDDDLFGQGGSDSIKGGNGNDILSGGDQSDSLRGDGGTDTIDGGDGSDSANGGGGSDTCTAEAESSCEI